MQQIFMVGDQPVPGYTLVEDLGGSAFYKLWRVKAADGSVRLWKVIDLVVGNAAIETRTLGLLIQLRHPHLNTLTNFWQLDDGKTLIIESETPKMSLRERLAQTRDSGEAGLAREELIDYIEQAAEGLDFLNAPRHQFQGSQVAIYHRALRPECLLLFDKGNGPVCQVSDFGLSKPVTEEVAQHSQGLVHYDYDPPEFFEGQTTPTSDQYSLAIVYYELRTGQMPFSGTMLAQLQARLNDAPNLAGLNEPERSVVKKALSRDPRQRFESCVAFAKQLRLNEAPNVVADAPTAKRLTPTAPSARPVVAPTPGAPPANRLTPTYRLTPPVNKAPELNRVVSLNPPANPAFAGMPGSTRDEVSGVRYNPPPSDLGSPKGLPPRSGEVPRLNPPAAAPAPSLSAVADTKNSAAFALSSGGLRDLRGKVSANSLSDADFNVGEETKIPVSWAVAIIAGALGLVYVVLMLLPAAGT